MDYFKLNDVTLHGISLGRYYCFRAASADKENSIIIIRDYKILSTTTISIDKDVRDRPKKCGAKDESYKSIIERLLDLYEEFDLEQYIEKQYQKLKKDKEKFISLEQYEAQRR